MHVKLKAPCSHSVGQLADLLTAQCLALVCIGNISSCLQPASSKLCVCVCVHIYIYGCVYTHMYGCVSVLGRGLMFECKFCVLMCNFVCVWLLLFFGGGGEGG